MHHKLADVARRLGHLPRSQRDDVLAGLREHIAVLRDAGAPPEDIVAQLGSPESIADAASSELPPRRPRFWDAKRWVQFVAVALSIRVAWMMMFAPMYVGTSSWQNSDGTHGEETSTQTMIEANGWPLVLMVAAIPLTLTLAPALARGRFRQTITVVCTALLAGISILTGFSVGPLYVLPLIAAACACLVPPTRHE